MPTRGAEIGSITIEVHDVFDTDTPPENKRLYKVANGIHKKTHEAVIRRELLFGEGDLYEPALVQETERNLRGLPFIRRVETIAVVNSSGTVDVLVRTYDAWSLEVITNVKRAGSVTDTKAGIAESNLLGQGKSVTAVYDRDGTAQSETFSWRDPQFAGKSHLIFTAEGEARPGSRRAKLGLERPFFASIAGSALGFSAEYGENSVPVFQGATQTGTARRHAGDAGFNYGIAVATSTQRTRHVRTGLMFHRANFQAIPEAGPGAPGPPEQFLFLQLGADWEELRFVKERHIQKFSHDEDFNLGLGVFPSLSWAPPGLQRVFNDRESQVLPSVTVRKGFGRGDQLLFLDGSYASRFVNGSNGNRVASTEVLYFYRGLPRQTVAVHAGFDHGWRLDPAQPLTLGESNGLRGYGLSHFMGDRRFTANLEDRLYLAENVWRLLDVGAVAFADTGYVWPAGEPRRLGDLKSSVGVGLRLAPSRSASNDPVRVDLARALNPNGTRSRWTLSILAGHAFGPLSDPANPSRNGQSP